MPAQRTSKPLAGYLRVSARAAERAEQDKLHSPDWQKAKIERLDQPVEFFPPELDVSGSKARRPVLESILAGIERGDYSGIAVADLDRLSRLSPRDRIELFERIENAGGTVVSASQNIDPTTPEGRFARDVFLGVARMQWEKYKDNYTRAKQHAHDSGMRLGPTPLGYNRNAEGKLEPDDSEARLVAEIFELCARDGLRAAIDHYRANAPEHKTGKRAGTRRFVNAEKTRYIIQNRVYLGEQIFGGLPTIKDAHKPLVTRPQFDAANAALKTRATRSSATNYPLSGLIVCGSCGNRLTGGRGGLEGQRVYRCAAGVSTWRGDPCPKPVVITADSIEAHIRETLADALPARELEQIDNHDYERVAAQHDADVVELEAFVIHTPASTPGYAQGLAARQAAVDQSAQTLSVAAGQLAKQGRVVLGPDAIRSSSGATLRQIVTDSDIRFSILHSGRGSGRLLPVADRVKFANDPSAPMIPAQATA